LEFDPYELEHLRLDGWNWKEIADLYQVNPVTLRRWIRSNDFADPVGLMTIEDLPDEALDTHIRAVTTGNRNVGYERIRSELQMTGVLVSKIRLREAIERVDPEGLAIRRAHAAQLVRGVYHVRRAGIIIHIDGHEKFPFGIYVYGGVDAASRRIMYARASDTKRAPVILNQYRDMIQEFGFMPMMVRIDGGSEFSQLVDYQIFLRGYPQAWADAAAAAAAGDGGVPVGNAGGHGDMRQYANMNYVDMPPVVRGKSTRNVRVERMWRDLRECVIDVFRTLKIDLIRAGFLPTDEGELTKWELYTCKYLLMTLLQELLNHYRERRLVQTMHLPAHEREDGGQLRRSPLTLWRERDATHEFPAPRDENEWRQAYPDAGNEMAAAEEEGGEGEGEGEGGNLGLPPDDGWLRPVRKVPFWNVEERNYYEQACLPLTRAEFMEIGRTYAPQEHRTALRNLFMERYELLLGQANDIMGDRNQPLP
jgi:hypothetical protein